MSNLRLINETISSTAVASISVTDVFSADYDIYKITVTDIEVAGDSYQNMRFINSSGSLITASNYDDAGLGLYSHTTFGEFKSTNDSEFNYLNYVYPGGYDDGNGIVIYVFNPFDFSAYTYIQYEANGFANGIGLYVFKSVGVLKQTSSITGFSLFKTGNTDNIKIRTYGLRVD